MYVQYAEGSLPILREVDVAVVGGSLAGIAAALTLAVGGLSVVVIESRTYLGREITATLRPWLVPSEMDADMVTVLPAPIRCIFDAHEVLPHERHPGREIPLHPDVVKRCLEDALLEANVGLLYACLPVALHQADDTRKDLIIGNKSGRQVIRCQRIIDATETALMARLCGGAFVQPAQGSTRFARTLEFDRVTPLPYSTLAVPAELQMLVAGKTPRLHTGYRGPQHVLIECDLDLAYVPGLEGSAHVEFEARRRTMHLASWLIHHIPSWRRGGLPAPRTSCMGTGRRRWQIHQPGPRTWRQLWCALWTATAPRPTCRFTVSPVRHKISGASTRGLASMPGTRHGSSIRSGPAAWARIWLPAC